MTRFRKLFVLPVTLSVSVAVIACATMTLSPFPQPGSSSFQPVESHPGISVFAEPVFDEQHSKEYFGVDLLENDILAVYVGTKNTNPDPSLMLPAESVRIAKTPSGTGRNDPERGDQQAGVGIAVAGTVLLSPIVILASVQQFSDASVVEENFERKKLRTAMVDWGEVVSGFAYFDWRQLKGTHSAEICWKLREPIKGEEFPVCYPIRLGG